MSPPIKLQRYFFPFVQVSADPEFESQEENDEIDIDFRTEVNVTRNNEENFHQVSINILAEPLDEDHSTPYKIELIAVGFFSVDEDWDDIDKLLNITGASMLYSAAREFIITITSRGPWPAVIIPTTSFLPPKPKKEAKQSTTKESSKSEKKAITTKK